MDRTAFHNLLKRYLEGKCTEEEYHIIDKWYELLDSEIPVSLDKAEWNEVENRLWNKIQVETGSSTAIKQEHKKNFGFKRMGWLSVAAIISAIIIGAYLYTAQNKSTGSIESEKVHEGLSEEKNLTDKTRQLTLEDGSRVTLQPGSKIAFPKRFPMNKREVYLEGEAFFEVTKNATRPFFVYNNNLVARVLGTSFNIKIINNKIEVVVKTGRVAVYENGKRISLTDEQKKENGVIVTPNQKVTYYTEDRHFVTSLADAPVPITPPENNDKAEEINFVFDDTPLSEVLQAIEKTYGIEIILANDNLKTCPFTGDITKPNLYNKLEFICQAFHAAYEIKGTKILIAGGKGCN
jgi:transmembrane sensor